MPAMTPVFASGPPSSRARTRLRRGPMTFSQHAEDVDLELLDLRAFEHGAANPDHAGTHLIDGHDGSLAGRARGRRSRPARRVRPTFGNSLQMLGVSGLVSIIARSRPTAPRPTPRAVRASHPTSHSARTPHFALRTARTSRSALRTSSAHLTRLDALCYVLGLVTSSSQRSFGVPCSGSAAPERADVVRVAVVLASCRRGLGTEFSTSSSDSTKRLFSLPEEALFVCMTTARLCVTVTAATMAELRARRDAVVDADLVELRVDTVARSGRGRRRWPIGGGR